MILSNIEQIERLLAQKNLSELDKLAIASPRTINHSNNFRSALMLSAHNIKHLNKIDELDASAIMLNLEDGVSPEMKPFALALCALFLSHIEVSEKKLIVRVNALDEGGFDEITYLNQFKPDAIRVPKIREPKEVEAVLALLDEDIELHLSVETKEAWLNLSRLRIHKRVTALYLGILDLFADLKLPHSYITLENPTMRYILTHFFVTVTAMGAKPVSFVYQDYKNMEAFKQWMELEKIIGFSAKGCLSPKQADAAEAYFVDEVAELEKAQTIVKLFEMNRDLGITGFSDEEYGFIDEPIYKGALSVIERFNAQ